MRKISQDTEVCRHHAARALRRARCFYTLGVERKIYDHRQQCYFTGQGNWTLVKGIDDQGKLVYYEIFFRLRRFAPTRLRMVVESAYAREGMEHGPGVPRSRRGSIRFYVMALKILRGEPLRDPRLSKN